MTGAEWLSAFRRRTGTTSVTMTEAQALVLSNESKNELAIRIVEANPQYFTVPVLFDLVTSSISAREYAWPDDILSRVVTVEAEFDSSNSPFKYIPLKPYPGGMERLVDDIGGVTEANITANFSNDDANVCGSAGRGCGAFYILTRRGIYILSGTISAVTSGGKMRYRAYPADLANLQGSTGLHIDPTTTTFGMPLQFHDLWVDHSCIKWKSERPNPLPLSEKEKMFEQNMQIAMKSIAQDDQRAEMFGTLPSRWNNGYDL